MWGEVGGEGDRRGSESTAFPSGPPAPHGVASMSHLQHLLLAQDRVLPPDQERDSRGLQSSRGRDTCPPHGPQAQWNQRGPSDCHRLSHPETFSPLPVGGARVWKVLSLTTNRTFMGKSMILPPRSPTLVVGLK